VGVIVYLEWGRKNPEDEEAPGREQKWHATYPQMHIAGVYDII
jgi:hypothetical protein